ncbi:unnamed protein product [Calypogeia fissa]
MEAELASMVESPTSSILDVKAAEAMATSVDVLLCCFLLLIALFIAYITKKYHFIYLPESASAMLLGMGFGVVSTIFLDGRHLRFDPQVFFYGLLPIIIFNAGYTLKKKDFFRNFTSIILFAVVGTVVSSLVYGLCTYFLHLAGLITHMSPDSPLLESLMFGSLISAIDPVATLSVMQDVAGVPILLHNLVLGESLVNDAAAIVLFRTFESFLGKGFTLSTIGVAIVQFSAISIVSVALGFGVSLLCALVLKYMDIKSEYAKFELAFILLSAYISYALAEICGLSGIMSLFFCGICNAHYGYYNASQASRISSKYAFEALSFLAEVFVFAYLGMQVVFLHHGLDAGLLLSAIPLCLLSRAVNIFPLAWLANKGRRRPISNPMKVMMWTCGLRGAVAYALAVNMPTQNRAIETTTLFVVLCTTLMFGCSTGPLLKALGLNSEIPTYGQVPFSGVKRGAGDQNDDWGPRSIPHQIFKWVDRAYLKPVFGGRLEDDLEEPWLNDDERYSEGEGNVSGRRSFVEDTLSSDDEFRNPEVTLFNLSPRSRDNKFGRYMDLKNGDH